MLMIMSALAADPDSELEEEEDMTATPRSRPETGAWLEFGRSAEEEGVREFQPETDRGGKQNACAGATKATKTSQNTRTGNTRNTKKCLCSWAAVSRAWDARLMRLKEIKCKKNRCMVALHQRNHTFTS